ncbi:hypothetical protein R6Q57_006187 [Mikania cordata]
MSNCNRYCLNTTVVDDAGNASVVFFNDALTQILKISCKDLVLTENNMNPRILPEQITAIIGTPLAIRFNMKKDGSIAVNNATITTTFPPATPYPKMSIRRTDQAEPSGTVVSKVARWCVCQGGRHYLFFGPALASFGPALDSFGPALASCTVVLGSCTVMHGPALPCMAYHYLVARSCKIVHGRA